jgi:hypothetical protein
MLRGENAEKGSVNGQSKKLVSGFEPEKQAVIDHMKQFLSSMQRIGRKNWRSMGR